MSAPSQSDTGLDQTAEQVGGAVAEPSPLQSLLDDPSAESGVDLFMAYGPNIVKAILLILAAWFIAGWAKAIVVRACSKANVDQTLSRFFGQISRWAILMLALLSILGTFGVETTSFAAVLGGLMVGIGMAMSGNLSNIAAGVMLLVFRPFKIGDYVSAGGSSGTVFEIGLFATTMDTPDNKRIIVPNGSIYGGTIENVSYHETRRVGVSVGTDYGADLDIVRSVLKKAAESIEQRVPDKDVGIVLVGLGGSSVDWSVRVWVPSGEYWDVKDELTLRVKNTLDGAGIGIPFPQLDVHLDKSVVTSG
jgi:small conductance mechanosensitive channel